MAQLSLTLILRQRWFFTAAIWIAVILVALGVIRDVANDEYHDGVMPAYDRVVGWLAHYALRVDVAARADGSR